MRGTIYHRKDVIGPVSKERAQRLSGASSDYKILMNDKI